MAVYYLQIDSLSRSAGRSAVGAAAYRAGERLRDERTGVLHNHSARTDVAHKEIVLPPGDGAAPAWAADRGALWNAAERAEGRRNSRVAREYVVALPFELPAPQRVQLARGFAQELAARHGVAVDLAVHDPRPSGDARNFHAHLLATTRALSPRGFGAKSGLDMGYAERQRLGLPPGIVEFNLIRERWAALTNEALHAAGLELQVDHRSFAARGIDREPMPHIPYSAVQTERRGYPSRIAADIRARYRERVQVRQQRRELTEAASPPQRFSSQALQGLEQVRLQARQAWLRLREQALAQPPVARGSEPRLARGAEAESAPERHGSHGPDRDLSR